MELRGLSLIDGRPVESGGSTFHGFDPAAGKDLPPAYVSATPAQTARAAESAGEAFRDYGWRPGRERADLLRRIASGIESLGGALIERAVRETALPAGRIEGERARTCMQLRLFADVAQEGSWADVRIDRGDPARKPQPKPDLRSMLRPMGPVAVFGASNFPLAFSVAGGDTAAALAAGCPVVVKAHPAHPGTSEMVGRAILDAVAAAGLPAGVFSLLFDAGHEVGTALIRHPRIKAAAFTGSRRGGLALQAVALGRPEPIPLFAEMSSVNPVFIFPGALRARAEAIAAGLQASMTLGVGQFCTQPGLIFVVRGDGEREWGTKLAARVGSTPAGTMLTPGIQAAYQGGLSKRSVQKGVRILARASPGSGASAGAALLGTDGAAFLKTPELADEIFGPCSLVVECASTDEFLACAEHLEGQLTATLWGESEELAGQTKLIAALEQKAGRLIVNGFPTGVEVSPAMVHGGPFPATTDSRFTSVGTRSILRFARPVAYQNFFEGLLPPELRQGRGTWACQSLKMS